MTERSVLVTGAGGTLGRRLVNRLGREGWRVRAMTRRGAVEGADETVVADLDDKHELEAAVSGVSVVLHAAAVTHASNVDDYARVNAGGTDALLDAARRAGVRRFVFVSTHVAGAEGGAYARSKLDAENLVRAFPFPFLIVRLPELYGGTSGEGLDRMIDAARRGRPILVVGRGDQEIRPVHVDDAVPALVTALTAPDVAGRVYTLAGERLSLMEAARIVARAFPRSGPVVRVPEWIVRVACRWHRIMPVPIYPDQLDRLRAHRADPTPEAASDLGFRPRTFEAGLGSLDHEPTR